MPPVSPGKKAGSTATNARKIEIKSVLGRALSWNAPPIAENEAARAPHSSFLQMQNAG